MPLPLPPFDLDLLRTFVAVADNGSFTRAAERLGRTQSTVSLQVKRLEDGVGCRLLGRDAGRAGLHLTPEGEVLLTYARPLLSLANEARSRLMEQDATGSVRLGTPEDFATAHLPDVLGRFARTHPRVSLEVSCDFTVNLLDGFSKGRYDLVLFKREPQGSGGGVRVWREVLVWAAAPRLLLDPGAPLPLVLAPAPDVYRKRALAGLSALGRPWRVVYACPSLGGLLAAVRAGLGVTVMPREMVPPGLQLLGPESGLPALPDTEIVLSLAPGPLPRAAELLAGHIVQSLERAAELTLAG